MNDYYSICRDASSLNYSPVNIYLTSKNQLK